MPDEVIGFNPDDAAELIDVIDERRATPLKRGRRRSRMQGLFARTAFVQLTSTTSANVVIATVQNGNGTNQNEIQSVYVQGATAGTFTLTFDDTGANPQTTGAIAYNASAATVKAALDALSNITSCTVTGTGTSDSPWLVTFTDAFTNFGQMTFTSSLTPVIYAGFRYDQDTYGTWAAQDAVLIRVPNSETPAISTRYYAHPSRAISDKILYTLATVPSTGPVTPTFSGVHVVNSTVLSVSTGTGIGTAVTFDTERYDTDSYHSTSSNTNRLVAPVTGYYRYGGSGFFTANATGIRVMLLNHSNVSNNPNAGDLKAGTATYGAYLNVNAEALFAAGEYASISVLQDSGGNLNFNDQRGWMSLIGT